jgi:hypothetical protein
MLDAPVLKGHGFSRAVKAAKLTWASQAAEKIQYLGEIPKSTSRRGFLVFVACGTTEFVPCYF